MIVSILWPPQFVWPTVVSTVSPTYAMEIQQASDSSTGFSGGEGLEMELREAYADGRLTGILNGCMYPEKN